MRITAACWSALGLVVAMLAPTRAHQQPPALPQPQAQTPQESAPPPAAGSAARAVGSMAELMSKIIYPTSDAVFYIKTRTPKNEAEWNELQGKTLMLAESANLLMMPGRARDQDRWMADSKLMLDAGLEAFRAARRHDVPGLAAVNDALYESCVTCHRHYRPNYGRGQPGRGGLLDR